MSILKSIAKGSVNVALSFFETAVSSGLSNQRTSGQISREEFHEKRERMKKLVNETRENNKNW